MTPEQRAERLAAFAKIFRDVAKRHGEYMTWERSYERAHAFMDKLPQIYGEECTTPFDQLGPQEQARLVDAVRDAGEGPDDKSTTEFQALMFLRSLNENDLAIWRKP